MNPLYNGAVHLIAACARVMSAHNAKIKKMIHGQSEAIYVLPLAHVDAMCGYMQHHSANLSKDVR